jgi:hypothetical protein
MLSDVRLEPLIFLMDKSVAAECGTRQVEEHKLWLTGMRFIHERGDR